MPGVFRLLATHSYAGTRQNSYAERKMKRALLISAVLLAGPAFGQEALNPVPQASTGATDQRGGELRRQQDTQGAEDAALNAG